MLNSHSIVSSSVTVRACSPWGGRWIGHWRTTWLAVCSSPAYSQASEEAIVLHRLCKQERKPTPVQRQLSRIHAVLGKAIPGRRLPVSGTKVGSIVVLPNHSPSIGYPPSAPHVRCCQMNWWDAVCGGYKWVSRFDVHLHSMDGWALSGADVQAPWHGVLGKV